MASKTIERIIIPIKAKVASQIMPKTTITSSKLTTPDSRAAIAPIMAVVPICRPFGCHITKSSVIRKMSMAISILLNSLYETVAKKMYKKLS
jgi:hypothetical protein